MSPENTQKLFEAFPQLYRSRFKPVEESMMSYGFDDCGDGWFDLLLTLSEAIENTARQEGLEQNSNTWPEVMQVKQKLGYLRFYLKNASEAMWLLIDQAVITAEQTCEVCGEPGSLVTLRDYQKQSLCSIHQMKEFLIIGK
jgi:hypothetical protein